MATSVDLKGLRERKVNGRFKFACKCVMLYHLDGSSELIVVADDVFFFSVVPYSSCFSCWFVLFCFVYFFI